MGWHPVVTNNPDDVGLFLFDVDGTLLKAGGNAISLIHRQAFSVAMLDVFGVVGSTEGIVAAGRTDAWILGEALRRHGLKDALIERGRASAYRAMETYVEQHVGDLHREVLPGVIDILAGLKRNGQMLGLLTGNLHGIAMAKMRRAGLAGFFSAGAFGEVSEERALLVSTAVDAAAGATGHEFGRCQIAVIGDTPYDVQAGKAYGTRTVGVASGPFSAGELQRAGADLVVASLSESDSVLAELLRLPEEPGPPLANHTSSWPGRGRSRW